MSSYSFQVEDEKSDDDIPMTPVANNAPYIFMGDDTPQQVHAKKARKDVDEHQRVMVQQQENDQLLFVGLHKNTEEEDAWLEDPTGPEMPAPSLGSVQAKHPFLPDRNLQYEDFWTLKLQSWLLLATGSAGAGMDAELSAFEDANIDFAMCHNRLHLRELYQIDKDRQLVDSVCGRCPGSGAEFYNNNWYPFVPQSHSCNMKQCRQDWQQHVALKPNKSEASTIAGARVLNKWRLQEQVKFYTYVLAGWMTNRYMHAIFHDPRYSNASNQSQWYPHLWEQMATLEQDLLSFRQYDEQHSYRGILQIHCKHCDQSNMDCMQFDWRSMRRTRAKCGICYLSESVTDIHAYKQSQASNVTYNGIKFDEDDQ